VLVDSTRVRVEDTRPTADFTTSPAFPLPGQDVTFTSASGPSPGKQIVSQKWDFDYTQATDGNISDADVDATGGSVTKAFDAPGPHTVALKVIEDGGGFDIETAVVVVNAPPRASFTASPGTPVTDEPVTFASTSEDPDGPLSQTWDTDNDGQFDDGTGAVARRTFTQPGSYTVRLRVDDSMGAAAISQGTIVIARRATVSVAGVAVLGMTVHISGRTTSRGAKLSRFLVRAPVGTRVTIRCKGKHCPLRTRQTNMKRAELRIKRLQRNLRAGTKIIVEGRLDGFVGKRVVYKIRKGKTPQRRDQCLPLGGGKPTSCNGP
jgi:PKD repeat protein